MQKAWMRELNVILTSQLVTNNKHNSMIFGSNWKSKNNDLSIKVTCDKYVSALKDVAVIELRNLSYTEVTEIVEGKYYNVEVQCGYRNGALNTIFKGVLYNLSNRLDDTKTNTIVMICTSYLVGKFGQRRLNLSLNSSINMYSQIKHVLAASGITDSTVSAQYQMKLIEKAQSITKSAGEWLEELANENESMIINTDYGVSESIVSIFDANRSNFRHIKLNEDNVILSGGYPTLTNEGLRLTVLPTFAFMCGDVIQLDNSIIDISTSSLSDANKNYGYFLDKNGNYMIMNMKYVLENRGSQFGVTLNCKTRSLISNYVGEI